MKIKLFVSASSNINSISHPYSISMIPEIIKFNVYESYIYDNDINYVSLFNRIKYTNDNFELLYDYKLIISMLDEFYKSYDKVIMILNNYISCSDFINEIVNKYKDKLIILYTNTLGYNLSISTIELDKNIKANMDIEEAIRLFNNNINDYLMLLYSPQEDILKSDYRYTINDELINNTDKFSIKRIKSNNTEEIKVLKNNPVVYLIKDYLKEINESNVSPFLMYSNENSYYTDILEKKLLKIHSKLKNIKSIPFSPIFIKLYGKYPVAIGFTKK